MALEAILEDSTLQVSDNGYQNAVNIATELQQAKQRIIELQGEMQHALDRLCGGLALGIRRRQPSLHAQLGDGAVRVTYVKKDLVFKPDLARQVWMVDSARPRFVSKFKQMYGHLLHLSSDLMPLANAVAEFFTRYYRSIGEEITGQGSVVVEGRRVSLGQLATMCQNKDKILREMKTEIW